MTANHDLERRIADFYATEPALRAPDRVLGNALTSIESTPQRRVLVQAPWRFRPLNTYSKLAIAAVAIVALAFGVRTLLPSDGVGDLPTPVPTATSLPSPTPTATPTQTAALELPADDRLLEAGRYYVDIPGSVVRAEFAVPSGNWRGNGWYIADGIRSISLWTVANVYPSACLEGIDKLADPPIGPTVEDLVAALDAQTQTDQQLVGRPTVGGYASTQIIMEPSEDLPQACLNADNMEMWVGPGGAVGRSIDTAEPRGGLQDVMWIVDAGGNRVVIVAYYVPDAINAAPVDRIIESIQFVLP